MYISYLEIVLCAITQKQIKRMSRTINTIAALVLLAPGLKAQTEVTVSTGAGNSEQVWYSLQNGEITSAPLASWDLAFEVTGFRSAIRVNTAKGIAAYETPFAFSDWENLTEPDPDNWTVIFDDETNWSVGALNHGNDLDDGGTNLGWGDYNMVTHQIAGTKVYALNLGEDHWVRLRINTVASGTYAFEYADFDGSNSHEGAVTKTNFTGKNFGYWSFSNHATVDPEPPTAEWDLLFTKYTADLGIPYSVAGALQNKNRPMQAIEETPTDEAVWIPGAFTDEINVIGYDWKSYDFGAGAYTTTQDLTFFMKDAEDNVWKLIFTGYGGSANGEMTFTQEMVSATGMAEIARPAALSVFPNPATNGQVHVGFEAPGHEAMLRVFNANGQEVMLERWAGLSGTNACMMNVDGLPAGVYVLRVETPEAIAVGKLVIEH